MTKQHLVPAYLPENGRRRQKAAEEARALENAAKFLTGVASQPQIGAHGL